MSATIMMPQQIESAIREMCSDAMSQAVAALAEKYSFNAEEANRFLAVDTLKIVRKSGPIVSTKDEKTKKATKANKADKPKRAKTGYLLYADDVRQETKESLTSELENDDKLKPQDVVKAIALQWKAETQDVRDEWNAKAKTPVTSDDDEAEVEVEVAKPKVAKPKVAKPKVVEPEVVEPEVVEPEETSDDDVDDEE